MINKSESLLQNIENSWKDITATTTGDCPEIVTIPAGTHIVRLLADPTNMHYGIEWVHQLGNSKVPCLWKSQSDCVICQHALVLTRRLKQLGQDVTPGRFPFPTRHFKLLMQVVETSNPGHAWQAGKVYVVIANDSTGKQLIEFIRELAHEANAQGLITAMLDPAQYGACLKIHRRSGRQTIANIAVHPFRKGRPVTCGRWYVPLAQISAFSYSKEAKATLEDAAEAMLSEVGAISGSEPYLGTSQPGGDPGSQIINTESLKPQPGRSDAEPEENIRPACFGTFMLYENNEEQCRMGCPFKDACAIWTYME